MDASSRNPPVTDRENSAASLLRQVSRTFAFGIEVLPAGLRETVRLAYLMCRIADTFEDSMTVPTEDRIRWLEEYGRWLHEADRGSVPRFRVEAVRALPPSLPERQLLEAWTMISENYLACRPPVRSTLARWIGEMTAGMAGFLTLEGPGPGLRACLETLDQLDRYEYCVAGTVGRMFDELIDMPRTDSDAAAEYGGGLQGTNILQDLSVDRQRGWCYVPKEVTARHGLTCDQFGQPSFEEPSMSVVQELAARSSLQLSRGLDYVLAIPRHAYRARIFCLAPLLFALRTLSLLVQDRGALSRRLRVPRDQISTLASETVRSCGSERSIRGLVERETKRLRQALPPEQARCPKEERR